MLLAGFWSYWSLIYLIKQDFFPAIAVSILLCGCTTWTLVKCIKKEMGPMQECCVLSSRNPGSNTQQNSSCMATCLPSHKPSLVRWIRHAEHCWRNKHKLNDKLLHMDMPVLADCQRLTSAPCRYKMQPRGPPRSDGW